MIPQETTHSSVDDASSLVDEMVAPTATDHDMNPEDLKEMVVEDPDDEVSIVSDPASPQDNADPTSGEDLSEKLSARSTSDITFRSGNEDSDITPQVLSIDIQSFVECLMSSSDRRRSDQSMDFCLHQCSVAKVAEAPALDEWEWDSG